MKVLDDPSGNNLDHAQPSAAHRPSQLVLSLFPGVGLLDRAFELEGYCVVRGPDLLWGGDVRFFHPPAMIFNGVIGGPPCQCHSRLSHLVRHVYGPGKVAQDLIPEFVRCIEEAQPQWWLSENVPDSPPPQPIGYRIHSQILDNRWVGGTQKRRRRITFGRIGATPAHLELGPELVVFEAVDSCNTVCASGDTSGTERGGISGSVSRKVLRHTCEAQGFTELVEHLCHPVNGPFTVRGAIHAIGNGVALPMGRAIARAVARQTTGSSEPMMTSPPGATDGFTEASQEYSGDV